ncbi:hypothetical protein IFU25_12290 [Pantoea agglomerans]|uniref:MrpH family fimbial adhesin n=1 Tax=Enterobacter agglomerans TaxID=549 RepID=UPI00177FA8D4|nr:hypothetical protein [Pantoea agglomerans]MBD8182472.1 hypothetical protein [Pantoea agglomerans]
MKNNILLTIMLLLGVNCISESAHAGAYVRAISRKGTLVTQQIIAWTEEDNAPNPCKGESVCYVGPDVKYSAHPPGLYGTCMMSHNCIEAQSYNTAKEVAEAYNKAHPIPFTASFGIENEDASCVGLYYLTQQPTTAEHNGLIWPGSVCGIIPPENQTCDLAIPTTIDFGSLNSWQVAGQKKTITGTITCSVPATLLVTATSKNSQKPGVVSFSLDGGGSFVDSLTGKAEINGKDAFTGVEVPITGKNIADSFNFSVTLQKNGRIDAGDYSATEIIIANYE